MIKIDVLKNVVINVSTVNKMIKILVHKDVLMKPEILIIIAHVKKVIMKLYLIRNLSANNVILDITFKIINVYNV